MYLCLFLVTGISDAADNDEEVVALSKAKLSMLEILKNKVFERLKH